MIREEDTNMINLSALNWGDAVFTVVIWLLVAAALIALVRWLIRWARS